ncbi:MAG TPA: GNVR domain-containing protein [Ignavibacteria bacterium]|nr:GNVR domain-containing protein [Ignavibacteria bacterium]HMR39963.1 GNVR domain-containing protein [Ignavibacteria bacterium]
MSNTSDELNEHKPGEFTLKDFIQIYREKRKNIFRISLIFGILTAIVVFFIMDPIFLSYGTVKTSGKVVGLNLGVAGSEIGDFGEVLTGTSYTKELAFYDNILNSRRCLEETIIKYNLMEENGYKNMQRAIKDFRENILYTVKDKVSGTMEVGVYNKDPLIAKEISDFLILQLDKINLELNLLNAKNQREFIEQRYEQSNEKLVSAEDSLKLFQDQYGLSPDVQIRIASDIEIQLEADIESEKIRLELLKKIISPNEDEVRLLEDKISALEKRLYIIQNDSDGNSKLRLKGSPDIVLKFVRLKRQVEIQNKILSVLLPLYEQAKIEEKREIPTILVLDQPFVPDEKTKPKRITSIIAVMFLSAVLTYLYYFIRTQLKRIEGINA